MGRGDGGNVDDVDVVLHDVDWIAYKEDNNGNDDSYGNNNDTDNVAPCCPCCYVTFKTPPIQKHSCFPVLLDSRQKLHNGPHKINNNKRLKTWYLRHFRKHLTKKQDQTTMDKNSQTSSS